MRNDIEDVLRSDPPSYLGSSIQWQGFSTLDGTAFVCSWNYDRGGGWRHKIEHAGNIDPGIYSLQDIVHQEKRKSLEKLLDWMDHDRRWRDEMAKYRSC